jgi:hypothetical protein
MSTKIICPECINKQEEIYRLREQNKALKAKLRIQDRKITEGFFGSSTPSSKQPVKANTTSEKKNGGAKQGHKGYGRKLFDKEQADVIETVECENICPECKIELKDKDSRDRYVIDIKPLEVKRIIYHLIRKQCRQCGRIFESKSPGVLPRNLYGNHLIAHIAIEHYIKGKTLGALEKELGIGYGALVGILHNLAKILKDIPDKLIEEYRKSFVKHADETGWRNDGNNGYAWLFATSDISIFRFRHTRAGKIAREALGEEKLPGVLVVDRYAGYNRVLCDKQYCYAHLFRTIKDMEKEFPDNQEIACFVQTVLPLLSDAMNLRSLPIEDRKFYQRARKTKDDIIEAMNKQANHAAIQNIQNIFRDNKDKLYHWANDRKIPADNNFAERQLRPLVIARKLSFGSQSDEGAKTREILMTVLLTMKKRTQSNIADRLKYFLDIFAGNSTIDVYKTLFLLNSS